MVIAIPILLLVMWFAMAGAARGNQYWAQALVGWLASLLRHVPFVGGFGASQVQKAGQWISKWLAEGAAHVETHVALFFGGLLQVVKFYTEFIFGWPIELLRVAKWLAYTEVPKLVHALQPAPGAAARGAARSVGLTKKQWADIKATAASAGAHAAAFPHGGLTLPDFRAIKWLRANYKGLMRAAAIAGGAAIPWVAYPHLRDAVNGLLKRLRAAEKRLGAATVAGVVVAALSKIGLNWLRCQKIRKYGPRVCHLDADWLENLFLDGVVIFGAVSVVTFARELRSIEDEAITVMSKLIREFPEPPKMPH